MSYGDPCANDPSHGPAIVGINSPDPSKAAWVCMDCFNGAMGEYGQVLRRAANLGTPEDPRGGPEGTQE